jgi:hypothetical protein
MTAQQAVAEARDLMESFDQSGAMTIGFEGTYTLTAEQMTKIAGALYLADCELEELERQKCKCNA